MVLDIIDNDSSSNSTFQCSICLENLSAPASINSSGSSQQATPVTSMPGVNRRGTNRQPVAHKNSDDSLTDVVGTKCGHLYHNVCLQEWFKKNNDNRMCPTCRKEVPSRDGIRRVYPGGYTPPPPKSDSPSSDSTEGETEGGVGEDDDEIKDIMHKSLVEDHEALLKKYQQLRENEGLKNAQITSLKEDNAKKATEIRKLKRKIADLEGDDSSDLDDSDDDIYDPSPNKRRA